MKYLQQRQQERIRQDMQFIKGLNVNHFPVPMPITKEEIGYRKAKAQQVKEKLLDRNVMVKHIGW